DEQGGAPAQAEQREPEEARRHPPRPFALALDEQVAEDRDERGGEGGVRDERPDRVRDQEGDLERVDRPDGAEVVARDDLADEPEDPREAGGEREDRRRAGEAPAARVDRRRERLVGRRAHGRALPLWTSCSRDCPSPVAETA